MRAINSRKLKELIRASGESAMARTALGSNVSMSTLQKLCAGTYGRVPRQALRDRLCAHFNVSEDVLFPKIDKGKRAS